MSPRLLPLALLGVLAPAYLCAVSSPGESRGLKRARQLQDYLAKERPQFEARETQRKDLMTELDRLNSEQNSVRQKQATLTLNQKELSMAIENLKLEVDRNREQERLQRQRLIMLLKVAHKVQRDGTLRFMVQGHNLSDLSSRARILYRTLRSHSQLTKVLSERTVRLAESQEKLNSTRDELGRLVADLAEQEELLSHLLKKKHQMLSGLNQKQNSYAQVMREYRRVSKHLATLFSDFEALRNDAASQFPNRGSLPAPLEAGRVVKFFGKSVHEKFGTITYQKGIEIEAAHNTPVRAVLPGVVEYDGWVKGLGNVVILHHGGGFYSLSAHLFQGLKPKGTKVAQGEDIGLVGDTGGSEKPSLYFELRENGKAVDPLVYLSRTALNPLN